MSEEGIEWIVLYCCVKCNIKYINVKREGKEEGEMGT